MKRLVQILVTLVVIFGIYLVVNITYGTITDFQPPEKMTLQVNNPSTRHISDTILTLLIWNIGYGGLGDEEDFFYDEGSMVRPDKDRLERNLSGIYKTINQNSSIDFVLLQEVDTFSKRSRYNNELTAIASQLPEYEYCYATNYSVKFNPAPFHRFPTQAMGKIEAGLATYSKYKSTENTRYQFPGNYSWPTRIYFLDRCFLLQRFPLQNGKNLVIINTHNSAYDDDGKLKSQQMDYLKEILISEYEKGNYVIVGGDWNQTPPGFDNMTFANKKGITEKYDQLPISMDYIPGWLWVYDPTIPSNRKLNMAYDADKSFTTLIDFYLVSPNIHIMNVNTLDMGFAYSDHQAVKLTIKIP